METHYRDEPNILTVRDGERKIKGLKSGSKQTYFIVDMHRIKYRDYWAYKHEILDFISTPGVHYNRALERSIIELRKEMSIKALADYLNLKVFKSIYHPKPGK